MDSAGHHLTRSRAICDPTFLNLVVPSRYDDRRLLLKRKQSDNSGQHLVAGLKGLGFGMLGGLTSVITEPIQVCHPNIVLCFDLSRFFLQGAASSGVPGFLSGLGWGAVGVVTKPVIGAQETRIHPK